MLYAVVLLCNLYCVIYCRKLSWGVVRLAFLPCLVEAVTAAVCAHLMLGFPLAWGFMLGFVLAAVSPAVVVPCMLSLQHKGLGVAQGIPTLVIAAASIDDVLAISGFGVVVGKFIRTVLHPLELTHPLLF